MTKRLKSKYKVCKKVKGLYKNLWAVVKSTKFRSVKILKRNSFFVKQKLNRLSAFNKYLHTKQNLKHFYCNLSENGFQRLLKKSITSESKTLNKLISLLESRIDTVLYRACFVNSLHMARQLINHGFVYVNSKPVSSTYIQLFPGDFLEVKDKNTLLKNKLIKALQQRRFRKYYNLIIRKQTNVKKKQLFFLFAKSLNYKNRNLTSLFEKICLHYDFVLNLQRLGKCEVIPSNLEVNYKIFKIIFLWDPKLNEVYYPVKIKYKKHDKTILYSYNEVMYND
uniref:Ribosomal protein S4 n=1 Tax=Chroomonas placoidea TaxID=173977 RepID=A0A2P1G830_9CRYP|nr:ribosomal protein S4 [Chroomonas placoidea]AVM81100.1 ribosomal protein S4 [Chroomonas placoidea]